MQDMFTIVGYGAADSRKQRKSMLSWLLAIADECGHKCQTFLLNGRSVKYKSIMENDISNENVEALCRDKSKQFLMMGYTAAVDISPHHYCLSIEAQSVKPEQLFESCVSQRWACYCIGLNLHLECAPTLYGRAVAFCSDDWVGREYRELPRETNTWSARMKDVEFCNDSSIRNVYEYNYCTGSRLSRLAASASDTISASRTICHGGEIIVVPCALDRLKSRGVLLFS